LRDSFNFLNAEAALVWGGFFLPKLLAQASCVNFCALLAQPGIFATEVFNTLVEMTVEKRGGSPLNRSGRDGSTFCTEARAGTFVVEL
jgi:hypothetical protein